MRIHPLAGRNEFALPSATPSAAEKPGDDFAQTLMDVLREVNASQAEGRQMQNALMTGQPVDIADVKIAMERASIAMNLTIQVRNKLLEAYQEINRMQV